MPLLGLKKGRRRKAIIMAIVQFKFDKGKDLQNIWKAANLKSDLADFSKNMKPELIYTAEGRSFLDSLEDMEKVNRKIYENESAQKFPEILDDAWADIEPHFFKRLERITGKSFKTRKITGYLTSISKCPYNPGESWFMVSLFNSIPGCMLTTAHELIHIHLHDYFFDDIKIDVGEEKAHDIKEAVTTVLLNSEFKDLLLVEDKGYEKHDKLRKFIKLEWEDNHDFSLLLDKCVELLRNNDLNQ